MFVSLDLAESLIGRHIWYAVPFAMVRGARKVFRPDVAAAVAHG
jgi:hypothetical protein